MKVKQQNWLVNFGLGTLKNKIGKQYLFQGMLSDKIDKFSVRNISNKKKALLKWICKLFQYSAKWSVSKGKYLVAFYAILV